MEGRWNRHKLLKLPEVILDTEWMIHIFKKLKKKIEGIYDRTFCASDKSQTCAVELCQWLTRIFVLLSYIN